MIHNWRSRKTRLMLICISTHCVRSSGRASFHHQHHHHRLPRLPKIYRSSTTPPPPLRRRRMYEVVPPARRLASMTACCCLAKLSETFPCWIIIKVKAVPCLWWSHSYWTCVERVVILSWPTVIHTGKSFSEAPNMCRTCCVPKLFWMSKQNKTKTTTCVHNMFCRYSELTIFMNNEQSVVILWVSWCKNKSFWQRFTCNRMLF